jgi:hypothetical protein
MEWTASIFIGYTQKNAVALEVPLNDIIAR